jgi:hypothetical protein
MTYMVSEAHDQVNAQYLEQCGTLRVFKLLNSVNQKNLYDKKLDFQQQSLKSDPKESP